MSDSIHFIQMNSFWKSARWHLKLLTSVWARVGVLFALIIVPFGKRLVFNHDFLNCG